MRIVKLAGNAEHRLGKLPFQSRANSPSWCSALQKSAAEISPSRENLLRKLAVKFRVGTDPEPKPVIIVIATGHGAVIACHAD